MQQRLELASLGLAGVVSMVFFLMPAVLLHEPAGSSHRLARAASDVVLAPPDLSAEPGGVSEPVLDPRPSKAASSRRPMPLPAKPMVPSEQRDNDEHESFGRRVGRLLVGDGRYRVQPFPVPSN